ncbi:hypothetical protein H0A36_07015 [Endozoicomonas sp. SM1973]|uniref:Uncharacterized protein n=1 Tax=Spartinivicinus marinus TaxID=2994442 RepID=A0A853HZH1_9GAMM|nr:hypothetical protein [Spartinivicinus marinus]MCX4025766.1 hypothetical protein [Spartinivicinus marinus]NYZ65759.1 hypothetical protein [Spartinivicinus marinus]
MNKLSVDTWYAKIGLVSWDFQLKLDNKEQNEKKQNILLMHKFFQIVKELGDFASPSLISFTTTSQGDDTKVFDSYSESEVLGYFRNCDDIEEVNIDLDLNCISSNDEDCEIKQGATLWLQYEKETERVSPVRLVVVLHVDLYSPVTKGKYRDNEELASKNGPRLTSFLSRIVANLNGQLMDIDAPGYSEVVNEYGFISK